MTKKVEEEEKKKEKRIKKYESLIKKSKSKKTNHFVPQDLASIKNKIKRVENVTVMKLE